MIPFNSCRALWPLVLFIIRKVLISYGLQRGSRTDSTWTPLVYCRGSLISCLAMTMSLYSYCITMTSKIADIVRVNSWYQLRPRGYADHLLASKSRNLISFWRRHQINHRLSSVLWKKATWSLTRRPAEAQRIGAATMYCGALQKRIRIPAAV